MITIDEMLSLIKKLSIADKERLKNILVIALSQDVDKEKYMTDRRFSEGVFCPHCNSKQVKRNGHRNGSQRYLCHNCSRTFSVTTNTIIASTKKDFVVWKRYIDCMIDGLSIRRSAIECDINNLTAFNWRHKILDALQNMADTVVLNGIVEGDETFFAVSYKGNHNKDGFSMPRFSHKRGSEIHIRGLSHEQICVPCAVNRNGLSVSKIANLGKPSEKAISRVFDNRIQHDSVMCVDGLSAYKNFANKQGISLIQLKSGKSREGVYHIQHINSYHSLLKSFMNKFKGVSSKYLNNYLIWNNFVNYAKKPLIEKKIIFLSFVINTTKKIRSIDISARPALPLLA